MDRAIRNKKEQVPNKTVTYIKYGGVLLVMFFLYFAIQIGIAAILGSKTQEIDRIRNEKERLRLQNEILTSQIDRSKSISSSQHIKEKYGLVEKDVIFLNSEENQDLALD